MLQIARVESPAELEQARRLFEEYAASLGFDLGFQGFEEELGALPGKYSLPEGRLLMARVDGQAAGCVALRKIEGEVCEMKRLYVRPECRGKGAGRALATAILGEAAAAGYALMRLDCMPSFREALDLYRSLGFHEIPPYCYNPQEGATFWELEL